MSVSNTSFEEPVNSRPDRVTSQTSFLAKTMLAVGVSDGMERVQKLHLASVLWFSCSEQ